MSAKKNRNLLKVRLETEYYVYYTKKSLLRYICDSLQQKFEVYHTSKNSIYAYLQNTSKDDAYISLRVSDHDIPTTGFIAYFGGADEEIIFRDYESLDDLDEKIDELKLNIEEFRI